MKRYQRQRFRNPGKYTRTESRTSSSSSGSGSENSEDINSNERISTQSSDELIGYESFRIGASRRITSSPVHFMNEEETQEVLTSVSSEQLESSDVSNESNESSELLYHGPSITAAQFSQKILELKSKHCLSDAAIESILKLMTETLPFPNKCPSVNRNVSFAIFSIMYFLESKVFGKRCQHEVI